MADHLTTWLDFLRVHLAPRREDVAPPPVELRRRLHGRPTGSGLRQPLGALVRARREGRLAVLAPDTAHNALLRALVSDLVAGGGAVPLPVDLPAVAKRPVDVFQAAVKPMKTPAAGALVGALRGEATEGRLVFVVEGYDGRPGMLGVLVQLEAAFPRASFVVLAKPQGFHFLLHYDVASVSGGDDVEVPSSEVLRAAGAAGEGLVPLLEAGRDEPAVVEAVRRLVTPELPIEAAARVHYALSVVDRLGPEDTFFTALGRPRQPVEIKSISVPGGRFVMGSPLADFHAEAPEHPVTVSPFRMGETPVTRGQLGRLLAGATHDDHPATDVSWYLARLFAHWVGGRLPTEAEWEHACRLAAPDATDAWVARPETDTPRSVHASRPDALGFRDLFGNVSEWCLDWHGVYPPFHRIDPVGRWSGHARVTRGGSLRSSPDCLRPSHRGYLEPWKSADSIGFRVAWPA